MKANDVERKSNALDFDKETEINGLKARFTQRKALIKDTIKENKKKFETENFPLKLASKEYAKKEKALLKEKNEAILRAQLIFFFKYDNYYQLIPDEITNKIIQGLGNRVFTKIFRVEVPHHAFVEEEGTMAFKVTSLANYGDVKFYRCVGEAYGEQVVVYIDKVREIPLGTTIYLKPVLDQSEIYEDDLNIRLY